MSSKIEFKRGFWNPWWQNSEKCCLHSFNGISRFSIFDEVWRTIMFSVKSWDTNQLQQRKDHGSSFKLRYWDSYVVKNWVQTRILKSVMAKIRKNAVCTVHWRDLPSYAILEGFVGLCCGWVCEQSCCKCAKQCVVSVLGLPFENLNSKIQK